MKGLSVLSRPKVMLIIPMKEFQELAKRERRTATLVEYSKGIVDGAYNHFVADEKDLIELNESKKEVKYSAFPTILSGLMRRLNLMSIEISSYRKFGAYVSPLLNESDELRRLIQSTDLLTDVMEGDIQHFENSFDRRIY